LEKIFAANSTIFGDISDPSNAINIFWGIYYLRTKIRIGMFF